MREYLIRFAQIHESFREAEIRALATLLNLGELNIVYYERSKPYCILRLPSEDAATTLIRRSILCQSIHELWGAGPSYDSLREDVKTRTADVNLEQYRTCSFSFKFDSFQGKCSSDRKREIVESFNFLGFDGPIKMKDPDLQVTVFEYFVFNAEAPSMLYLGRWIANSDRDAILKYDLKKRRYIGLTSMDAELSLVTANLTHAAPGRVVYDPFVGTGSFSVAAAHFGAAVLGSDIDGRTIRGSSSCNHLSNYAQYNLTSNFFDNFIADLTNSPLRIVSPWLHGIACDPPYGVREGPRVLGYREADKDTKPVLIDGTVAHMRPGYIPPKRPYGFDDMLSDILEFGVRSLVPDGRLSLWMPTADDEDVELGIPQSPGLELLSVCVQHFNKWSRRLLTYRRIPGVSVDQCLSGSDRIRAHGHADDLNRFRKKYFQGFRQET